MITDIILFGIAFMLIIFLIIKIDNMQDQKEYFKRIEKNRIEIEKKLFDMNLFLIQNGLWEQFHAWKKKRGEK